MNYLFFYTRQKTHGPYFILFRVTKHVSIYPVNLKKSASVTLAYPAQEEEVGT